jgi:hypothetical protein
MDLTLYVIFIIISLFIIFLGLYRTEHTELGLVGFIILFMLSLVLLGGDIQYKVGMDINTTYSYDDDNTTMTSSYTENRDVYDTFTAGGTLSHLVGWLMAVMSFIGFIGVLVGIKFSRGYR